MNAQIDLADLGKELVEAAENEDLSPRGLINELFPYVYEASNRMSCRAISRWLEGKGAKLSAVTIAKALRNPEQYWEEFFEKIEPQARIFCQAHKLNIKEVLLDRNYLDCYGDKPPTLECYSRETGMHRYDEYERAKYCLEKEWFSLSDKTREACLSNVELEDAEPTANDSEAKD